jgi:4,5-dihydroxyphthalate decarboxylase
MATKVRSKASAKKTPRATQILRAKSTVKAKSRANAIKATSAAKPAIARRSPGKVRLTMMTGDYEIVRALKDGTVKPKGIDLVMGGFPGADYIHDQVEDGKGCDINEFNGGAYVIAKQQGGDFTALPVFLHRRFRHGFIYVNKAKVQKPSDLIGKRIGTGPMGAAANYWMRAYLEDAGVSFDSVTWVYDRVDGASRATRPGVKIEQAPKGKTCEQMLLDGEIEGMISPSINRMIDKHDSRVGRLWPDYKNVELDYYKRTGIFPIMHVTTIPMEIVAKYPWVVESLTHAFEEAKQLAFQRLINPRIVPLAFYRSAWEEERALLGPDPWEYGMSERNQKNYGTLVKYVHDQLLTGPTQSLHDLFPKEAFEIKLPLPTFHKTIYGF